MRWLRLVWQRGRAAYVLGVLAVIGAGLASMGLVATVRRAVAEPAGALGLAPRFLGIAAALVVCIIASRSLSAYVAQKLILPSLRRSLVESFLDAPFATSQKLGPGRLMAALTDGTFSIGIALEGSLALARSIVASVAIVVYLAWLDLRLFGITVGALAISFAVFFLQRNMVARANREANRLQDKVHGHVQSLLSGVRELKLSGARRTRFLDAYAGDVRSLQDRLTRVALSGSISGAWSSIVFLVVIGVVLLSPDWISVQRDVVAGYVLSLIYLQAELHLSLGTLPLMQGADAGLAKIDAVRVTPETPGTAGLPPPPTWRELELREITLDYAGAGGERGFRLGPVDLTLRPGQVVFVVGGNGSGKSTLARILTGLYAPDAGSITFDGKRVGNENRADYRELFSAVLSDWHVFPRLYGIDTTGVSTRAKPHLDRVQLTEKVTVDDKGAFSTLALSTGQLKRLALVTALLEDRPVYVFDEWASDQDPAYKRAFYETILPELKARGKAVLVITHDDRFFSLADTVVKLDCGRIVSPASAA